jgi:hypothetical protein
VVLSDLTAYLVTTQKYEGFKFSVCELKILPFQLKGFCEVIACDIQTAFQIV